MNLHIIDAQITIIQKMKLVRKIFLSKFLKNTIFFYVVFVYLTQYLSWNGSRGLLEQHAFLVPTPGAF